MKPESSIDQYGEKAKDGVIIITTKQAKDTKPELNKN